MTVQASLYQTWWGTQIVGFLTHRLKYFSASDSTTVTDESLSQTTETEVEKVPEKNPIIIPDGLNEVRTESPSEDEAANQITAQQQSTSEEVGCSIIKLGIVGSDQIVFLAKAVH